MESLLQTNYLQNMTTTHFQAEDASIHNIFHNSKFGDTAKKPCRLVAKINTQNDIWWT